MKILVLLTVAVMAAVAAAPKANADVRDLSGAYEGETQQGSKVRIIIVPRANSVGTAIVTLIHGDNKGVQLLYAERKNAATMGLKPFALAPGGEDLVLNDPVASLRVIDQKGKSEIVLVPNAGTSYVRMTFKRRLANLQMVLPLPEGRFGKEKAAVLFSRFSEIDGGVSGRLAAGSEADYAIRNEQTGIHTLRRIIENSNFREVETAKITGVVISFKDGESEFVAIASPASTNISSMLLLEKRK
ncbi:MAG: hypothetical protein AB7F59_11655 [Bdellovibrionales bacterium]